MNRCFTSSAGILSPPNSERIGDLMMYIVRFIRGVQVVLVSRVKTTNRNYLDGEWTQLSGQTLISLDSTRAE